MGTLLYFGHIGPDWLAVGPGDSCRCAHQLGALLRGRDAVVNLIPYNTACAPRPHLRQDPSTSFAHGPVHICAGTNAHIWAGPTPTSAPGPHPEYRDFPENPAEGAPSWWLHPRPAGCSAFARGRCIAQSSGAASQLRPLASVYVPSVCYRRPLQHLCTYICRCIDVATGGCCTRICIMCTFATGTATRTPRRRPTRSDCSSARCAAALCFTGTAIRNKGTACRKKGTA